MARSAQQFDESGARKKHISASQSTEQQRALVQARHTSEVTVVLEPVALVILHFMKASLRRHANENAGHATADQL